MPKTRAFVGIDAGTTGCAVMIFNEIGVALGKRLSGIPMHVAAPRLERTRSRGRLDRYLCRLAASG